MDELTPKEIVAELDRFIVGQAAAKRAVAIALRNRWRRQCLPEDVACEIMPKNILMIGPTGVGKTEISRRLAKLAAAPFIKVEATKFTEVGYVGRDVEQIVRDLLEVAVEQMTESERKRVEHKARSRAIDKIIRSMKGVDPSSTAVREQIARGDFNSMEVTIEVRDGGSNMPQFEIPGMPSANMAIFNINEMLGKMGGASAPKKTRTMLVGEALEVLAREMADEMIDEDDVVRQAIHLTENSGIVFLDEIDKVCSGGQQRAADISREGVQRDLLPLIEGTTVMTKRGGVNTSHILFIASGAFHLAKPSDMLPELQGRLPIRVEMSPLTLEDFEQILTVPEHSLSKQYAALMATETVSLSFADSGIRRIAEIAVGLNSSVENIGARRLHTVIERVLDDISFNASQTPGAVIRVDADYVDEHLGDLTRSGDLSHFVL